MKKNDMKKPIIVIITVSLLFMLCISCKKEDVDNSTDFVTAKVIDGGAVEVDGCGWLVRIDDVNYHPVNLPLGFQENELSVKIQYHEDTTLFLCGLGAVPIPSIFIEKIEYDLLELIYPDENNYPPVGDMFFIDTAYIQGDILKMIIGYSGGCEVHNFEMYVITENPDLMLSHNANNDACEAYLHSTLHFNLKTLQVPDKNSITFNLRNTPIMSSYYAILTYNY